MSEQRGVVTIRRDQLRSMDDPPSRPRSVVVLFDDKYTPVVNTVFSEEEWLLTSDDLRDAVGWCEIRLEDGE